MADHDHTARTPLINRAFKIGILLNISFVIIEGGFGLATNALSLLADAGHNLSDVLGLLVSWVAVILSQRERTDRLTYGYKKSSILAALFNAVFLLVAIGGIVVEAIQRLQNPQPVLENDVMIVAAIGIVINGFTAWLFMKDQHKDLNVKGAFIHMAGDAAISVGVVFAALIMKFTNWFWLDPVFSLVIALVILISTWGLLKSATELSLDAVPQSIDLQKVKSFIQTQDTVTSVHDLHIWAMSTTENALTAHVIRTTLDHNNDFIRRLDHELTHNFDLNHTTIQVELGKISDESTDHCI
ncbi:cation efflux protein [Agrilactobacillus composti DSM 18527 = JCM 14202]|uniref:Cation efflux protein n=1 Tax=Agrilactobacillus composti DSM 18527 = JCM 14202 TaxID=1423734 RepID=X0PR41_9LACO|nr:cation diffusion facilitator family transporter [Agrilactobacillus composti]KRM31046.1 cation efflux protein [Agrilactobacillus composti DSM 18527 = JCM 14202]GAF39576.1 cobalt-zinc-cadmium resistance protein CzcD [Agrilactobacillus composti DSM 18527 = JCM 14202]